MDLQTMMDNAVAAHRKEQMKTSPQLTLGELILKLEPIVAKQQAVIEKYEHEATVRFDFASAFPVGLSSWRGSYDELAVQWDVGGYDTRFSKGVKPLSVSAFVELLKGAIGKEYTGWKGGEFVMGKNTPLWVSNPGNSDNTAIVDVVDEEYYVRLITQYLNY